MKQNLSELADETLVSGGASTPVPADTHLSPKGSISPMRCYPLVVQATANFNYELNQQALLRLYDKAKDRQWNANTVVDWTHKLKDENPLDLPPTAFPLGRSAWFQSLSSGTRMQVEREYQGWMVSQFLHGEQFGVLTASRIALEAPDHESKFFAATQAVDEARHLETFLKLSDKIGVLYPVSKPFGDFLDGVITAKSLDLVYLGLQIIGEGIGLASFSQIRKYTADPLVAEIYARIMEDEARHVAFGQLYLGPLYRSLSSREMAEREEFVMSALELMSERFFALEVWERLGLPPAEAVAALLQSPSFRIYRRELFNQIVPMLRDLCLWTPRVEAFMQTTGHQRSTPVGVLAN